MAIKVGHELHKRRLSRNVGVGVTLILFVGLVYGVTVAKVGDLYKPAPAATEVSK
ncbi:hypothetical protein [Aliiroseovarius sediminilitoris]|nr:hypothetical protein [Aliiroseovarius sediminilitoris]